MEPMVARKGQKSVRKYNPCLVLLCSSKPFPALCWIICCPVGITLVDARDSSAELIQRQADMIWCQGNWVWVDPHVSFWSCFVFFPHSNEIRRHPAEADHDIPELWTSIVQTNEVSKKKKKSLWFKVELWWSSHFLSCAKFAGGSPNVNVSWALGLQGLFIPCPARLVFGGDAEEASETLQSSQECYSLWSLWNLPS